MQPLSYFFISPLIYVQIGFYFAVGIGMGLIMRKKIGALQHWQIFAVGMMGMVGIYILAYILTTGYMESTMHPLWMAFFALVALGCFRLINHKGIATILFLSGMPLVLSSFYFIVQWIMGNQWGSVGKIHLGIVPLVLVLTGGVTMVIYVLGRWQQIPWVFNGINLSLIFGHMIDGWTSYLAVVDPLNMGISYGEKHPIPLFLMEIGNGIAYPLTKILVIFAIIYGTDVYLKADLANRPTLTNLVKFFVLILGLSPGLRDVLRIIMGI
jgi:uncharacterized membrane protein